MFPAFFSKNEENAQRTHRNIRIEFDVFAKETLSKMKPRPPKPNPQHNYINTQIETRNLKKLYREGEKAYALQVSK